MLLVDFVSLAQLKARARLNISDIWKMQKTNGLFVVQDISVFRMNVSVFLGLLIRALNPVQDKLTVAYFVQQLT